MERPNEREVEQTDDGKKTIDVYPLSKGKRMLLFLGDFLLAFILAIFLSNVAAFPIGKAITGFDSKEDKYVQDSQDRYAILYDNHLLYNDAAENKNNFEENAQYTYQLYLTYYLSEENPAYEVFENYYSQFPNRDGLSLAEIYEKYDRADLFEVNADGEQKISLTDESAELLSPILDSKDKMGNEGQSLFDRGFTDTFIPIYNLMLDDIEANDLRSPLPAPSRSYNQLSAEIMDFESYNTNLAIACSAIAFAVSCAVLFFAYPLINQKGRTPTQSIMKIDRADKDSLKLLKRPIRAIYGLYQTLLTLPCLLFVSIPTVNIGTAFSIAPLTGISFSGLILVLCSMFFVIFDKYNRGLSEFFTVSIALKEEMLDEVYRAKGYYV